MKYVRKYHPVGKRSNENRNSWRESHVRKLKCYIVWTSMTELQKRSNQS